MKRFELHPPVKKVGMKKIFLSHGTKRFFSYPLFVPRNKKILFIPTFFTGGCSLNLFIPEKVFLTKKHWFAKYFASFFRSQYFKAERVLFGLQDWKQLCWIQSFRPKSTLSAFQYWLLKNSAPIFCKYIPILCPFLHAII